MPPEEDDPPRQNTINRSSRQISDLRETFLAAGYDPASSEHRARFGEHQHWLREYIEKRERRWEWTAKLMGGVVVAILTWAGTVLLPFLARIWVVPPK